MSARPSASQRPYAVEVLLAVLVLVLGIGELWVPFGSRQGEGEAVSNTVAVVLVAGSLLWCRRRPLVPVVAVPLVWGATALLFSAYVLFYGSFVPLLVGVFMVARYGRGREPYVGAAVAAATLLAIDLWVPLLQEPGEIGFHWTVTTLIWGAGTGLRVFERRARESARRAVEAEFAAAAQAAHAVLEERTRIARELHDIVAHAMSSMVVQAGAAEQARGDEEFRSRALATIRETGVDALAEMRRLVAMLRSADDEPALTPQPRLAALPALVERASASGPPTTLTVRGSERPLPAGLDLAAYRIVQEALTNVRRHAGASHCEVTVDYVETELRLEVRDDGRGPAAARPDEPGGHGLVGMRERAALYGGEVDAGAAPGGGFVVRVRLPVAVAP
jgi:signal transduction histidine kinase